MMICFSVFIVGMKSRVHPKYKTKYHVDNWSAYERALVRRGDITLLAGCGVGWPVALRRCGCRMDTGAERSARRATQV